MGGFLAWLRRLFGALPVVSPLPGKPPTPISPSPVPSRGLLEQINLSRAVHGLPPLTSSPQADSAAFQHAAHMRVVQALAHEGIGDGDLSSRLAGVGIQPRRAGETIARGQQTPYEVVQSWLGSPGHREILLGGYTYTGLGQAGDFWCAVFYV